MAYTDADTVALHLGRTLTVDQEAQVDALVPAATAWIDARTNRSWELTAPITGEAHALYGPCLYLKQAPVASVEAVSVRSLTPGATARTLTAGVDYELLDAATGLVLIGTYYTVDYRASVDYTPAVPLDGRIALAATMLVAAWLRPALDGITGDIQSYRIGQDLQVTYRDPGTGTVRGVPDDVVTLVDQCRRGVPVFA
jgi:hypothetical protein